MSEVECPCCNKGVQSRHTYMTNLPSTVVCTGCGSWYTIDVENSGGGLLAALIVGTVVLAFFWPMALILLPVYLVVSTGSSQNFIVDLIRKPRTELWTISRETGDIERINSDYAEQRFEKNLSAKIGRLRPANTLKSHMTKPSGFKKKFTAFRTERQHVSLSEKTAALDVSGSLETETSTVTH